MLAGLLVAPTRFAPTNNLERSQGRAATILRLMNEQGYLTDAETKKAQANPAQLSVAAEKKAGGYFADWVMSTGPEFFTRKTTEDVIIKTTLDQRIQKAAVRLNVGGSGAFVSPNGLVMTNHHVARDILQQLLEYGDQLLA